MLFHEIYGSYFQVVADILTEAAHGCLTHQAMTTLIQKKAFAESVLSIPAALNSGDWPLLDKQQRSVLQHDPTMPMTTVERQWLKALLLDPRIRLFQPDAQGLADVEPLYTPDVFVWFDQYADGDPYEDERYVACFRTILAAVHQRCPLCLQFNGHTGLRHTRVCDPSHLEYSAKDDKFRLFAVCGGKCLIVNLARICHCQLLSPQASAPPLPPPRLKELVLLLHDERNGLERALLHFSHFEKETQKLADHQYQIRLHYHPEDETELLIRVLSFGPVLQVTAPARMVGLVRERIARQLARTPIHEP